MLRFPARMLAACLSAGLAAACAGSEPASSPSPPTDRPSLTLPVVEPPPTYQPPPLEDPTNPVLIAYCSAQDRVVMLQGGILAHMGSVEDAVRKMRQAKRAALLAVPVFEQDGKKVLAKLAQRWGDSFDLVIARLERGTEVIVALKPSISALGKIERRFSCELDG